MKRISVVMMMWVMLLTTINLFAQNTLIKNTKQQLPMRLAVSASKTTNLVFPYSIKSVDIGSRDLLAQKAQEVENVLQLKARKDSFFETNITVITSDGQLYSFIVTYAKEPSVLNMRIYPSNVDDPVIQFSAKDDDEAAIKEAGEIIATKDKMFNKPFDKKYDISIWLTGLYIKDDVFYFQLQLANASNISYQVDQLRFYIHDQQRNKRTASQENDLALLQITGNVKVIRGKSTQTIVVAIPKFTIPDQKLMAIQLMELKGGRHLHLEIKNKKLLQAVPF